jgi:phospholipid transport system substrate-binding protein
VRTFANIFRPGAALAVLLCAFMAAPVASSAAAEPAAAQIQSFDSSLLEVMKSAKSLGVQGRYRRLQPVTARSFDFPTMIRFAVGPTWSSIAPGQQQQLTEAFARLTAASYAHNFNGYSGEIISVDPNVVTRGPDKVVTTHLASPNDAPVTIAYRMREVGGTWKIIDVFYNGAISQLTTRRADFAASLAQGGAPALIAHLNALVDKQLK